MRIHTLPVYSKLADEAAVRNLGLWDKLPMNADGSRWRLSQHQVETYQALTAPDGPDVVFNTAMTGDGKSLAGQLPALAQGWRLPVFAMYPTNELIRDQLRQAEKTWAHWQQPSMKLSLDSNQLDQIMESGDFKQRGEALLSELRNHDVVLTNPDIFHYVMQMYYMRVGKQGDAPDKVFSPLINKFQQFTFDEFHIFETPQIVSVLNAMLLVFETTKGQKRKFLFQSATPKPLMVEYLHKAGLPVQVIEGSYTHSWQTPAPSQWRQILHGSEIFFDQSSVEAWVDAHLEDTIIPFFRDRRPAAKGAIIVNSVVQAKRLTVKLKAALKPYHVEVEENTGLTGRGRRADSYVADILVGTSTVDVGVDFQINFLVFESRDAGSFLQRLGRLGRHASYERNGNEISFEGVFQAHALLPSWIFVRLFESVNSSPAQLRDGMEIDRQALAAIINAAFPPPADFRNYAKVWGGLQSVKVVHALRNPTIRDSYAETYQALTQRYETTFGINLKACFGKYKALKADQPQLLEEASSFRGGSYFECGLIDPSELGTDQVKTYDLLALLSNAILQPLGEDEFWHTVKHLSIVEQPLRRHEPLAFFRLGGFSDERSNFRIKLQREIGDWATINLVLRLF